MFNNSGSSERQKKQKKKFFAVNDVQNIRVFDG